MTTLTTRTTPSEPAARSKAERSKTTKRSPEAAVAKQKPAKRAGAKAALPAGAQTAKPAKAKQKLVRDGFTIPKNEYAILDGLKQRAAGLARPVKKSEVLRAGIAALHAMSDPSFLSALDAVPSLKTGRPKNADASPDRNLGEAALAE